MIKLNVSILKLAIPLILSNLTVPLLGFTNTYIAGHLHDANTVAAVGLGMTVFNLLFWAFSFLRMGTTGLVAQAYGQDGVKNTWQTISHSLILAFCVGIVIIFLQQPLKDLIFGLIPGDAQVKVLAEQYYSLRILAAPATLINYVLIGALLGLQNMISPLVIMMTINGLAIMLGVELSLVQHYSIKGIAIADVIAQYSGALIGLAIIMKRMNGFSALRQWKFQLEIFYKLTRINSNIFMRTLFLIASFTFFTLQSLNLGAQYLAANTILMSFMTLTSFAQDGFANVAESLVGQKVGQRDYEASAKAIQDTGRWAAIIALFFSLLYCIFAHDIISMMTTLTEVKKVASSHILFVILLPLISVACFFFDGVYIGANKFREMRNTMFGAFVAYLGVWWLLQDYGNIGLWVALLSFFFFRGLFMGSVYWWLHHRKRSFFAFS